jgi:phosphonoacetaldehyde hydrolase
MSHRYLRRYAGPVQAVVLDWAGTAVDFGCLAPVGVFIEVFARRGVTVTLAEAREPMGTHKRDHIARMLAQPALAARWREARGEAATEAEIDAMYRELEPLALEVLDAFAEPVPGLLNALEVLRARGIRVGSTTGYNRAMLDRLVVAAAGHGYRPDAAVAASEVPAGRPAPYMAWEAVARLGVVPVQACVKIGDTPVDVEEGLNAGMWSVGVAATGNEIGLSRADFEALSTAERRERVERARDRLARAGAHLVVDSAAELPVVVETIEGWLRAGRSP